MLPRKRNFQDPQSGKLWGTFFDGSTVHISSGSPGKEKVTEKPQSDDFSARRFLEKEEGARLRKGFVLRQESAEPGEPLLLRHIGRGYTGALVVADVAGSLLTNLIAETSDTDHLWLVDRTGVGVAGLPLGGLVWDLACAPSSEEVLLLVDHQVKSWNRSSGALTELTGRPRHPVSFLSRAGDLAAWYEQPEVGVRDLATGRDLLRIPVEPELVSGHSLQLSGALSSDGALLAFSAGKGALELYDVKAGQKRRTVNAEFAMTDRMAFTHGGDRLVAKEKYGGWRLLDFDLESGTLLDTFSALGDTGNGDFAVDPKGGRIAVNAGTFVHVLSLDGSPLLDFRLDQTVKRAALAWTGDGHLAVRTDMGLLGVYAAPILASPSD